MTASSKETEAEAKLTSEVFKAAVETRMGWMTCWKSICSGRR